MIVFKKIKFTIILRYSLLCNIIQLPITFEILCTKNTLAKIEPSQLEL